MKIKELKIQGYKSLGDITITEPNPFTVFVGPNAAGKSNIFESIEFMQLCNIMSAHSAISLFGNVDEVLTNMINKSSVLFKAALDTITPEIEIWHDSKRIIRSKTIFWGKHFLESLENDDLNRFRKDFEIIRNTNEFNHFTNFTRLFVNNASLVKRNLLDDFRLNIDGSNLEKVLKRIFQNKSIKYEIIEILQSLIPGFESIDIVTEELSGTDNLLIYETHLNKPLTKRLISDGTYNIIALITALYQSEKPQFLCIEEPENGLNPKVVGELVNIFRAQCIENGHFIWLNTHSQTLVSQLTPEEVILVDKVEGLTQVKQIKGLELHGMKMDEALLTNTLGGGIPW